MEKNQEETIIVLKQKCAQTEEDAFLLYKMCANLKSAGLGDLVVIMAKEQQENIELIEQEIVQIQETENMIDRVYSLRDEFQVKVAECIKELSEMK